METIESKEQVRLSYKQEVRGSSPRAPTICYQYFMRSLKDCKTAGFDTGPPAFSTNLLLPYQNLGRGRANVW